MIQAKSMTQSELFRWDTSNILVNDKQGGNTIPPFTTEDKEESNGNLPIYLFKVFDNHCKNLFVPIFISDSIKKLKKAQIEYNLSTIYISSYYDGIRKRNYYQGVCLKLLTIKRYLKILRKYNFKNKVVVENERFYYYRFTQNNSNLRIEPLKQLNRKSNGSFSKEFEHILKLQGFDVKEKGNVKYHLSLKTIKHWRKPRKWGD